MRGKSTFLVYFKPTILYLAAYILTVLLHEFSHAVMANMVGIPAVVYPLYTNISRTTGSVMDKAMISIAGPFVSLIAGLVCLYVPYLEPHRRRENIRVRIAFLCYSIHLSFYVVKNTGLRLFLLYACILGISIFLGNMFSASMAGDFNHLFNLLHFKTWIRVVVTIVGLLGLMTFMYSVGKVLARFTFSGKYSKRETIISTIVFPWLLGTLVYILALLPLPNELIVGIIASSIFWIFSIAGAWFYRIKDGETLLQLNRTTLLELVILILCILSLREVSHGVSIL